MRKNYLLKNISKVMILTMGTAAVLGAKQNVKAAENSAAVIEATSTDAEENKTTGEAGSTAGTTGTYTADNSLENVEVNSDSKTIEKSDSDEENYIVADAQNKKVGTTVYNGVDYSSVYDYNYYISHNPDIAAAFGNDDVKALQHFVNYGMNEGRSASASFDVHSYRNEYADLRNAFGHDYKKYYEHYINHGRYEQRNTVGVNIMQNPTSTLNGINYGLVYDYNYYINANRDVANAFGDDEVKALQHFVSYGENEGRSASASFDVHSYRNLYSDLRNAYGLDYSKYYIHYINYGNKEGRKATGAPEIADGTTVYGGVDYSSVYNYKYYISHNADVKNAFGDDDAKVLQHYILYGINEGRQGSENFDIMSYRYAYPDLRRAYRGDNIKYLQHYISNGRNEGRSAVGTSTLQNVITDYNGVDYSPVYSFYYYENQNPDLKNQYGCDDAGLIEEFVTNGMKTGRMACSDFQATSYQNRYPDLRKTYRSDMTQYVKHWIEYGKAEGRTATGCNETIDPVSTLNGIDYSPVYDFATYRKSNSYIENTFGGDDYSSLEYFVNKGMDQKIQTGKNFNVSYYMDNYDDLYSVFGNNYRAYYNHYMNIGKSEGRNASTSFYTYQVTKISNSGHDENGNYYGGAAGDQTGTEWAVIDWFNRPWSCVLRYSDPNVRNMIATLSEQAAANNHIGYDMYQRTTYWNALQNAGYSPLNITVNCEDDCSAGVSANIKATGYLLGIGALQSMPETSTTYTMRSALSQRGFQVLTGDMYTKGCRCLLRGDILLNDNHHVAVNLTDGRTLK